MKYILIHKSLLSAPLPVIPHPAIPQKQPVTSYEPQPTSNELCVIEHEHRDNHYIVKSLLTYKLALVQIVDIKAVEPNDVEIKSYTDMYSIHEDSEQSLNTITKLNSLVTDDNEWVAVEDYKPTSAGKFTKSVLIKTKSVLIKTADGYEGDEEALLYEMLDGTVRFTTLDHKDINAPVTHYKLREVK